MKSHFSKRKEKIMTDTFSTQLDKFAPNMAKAQAEFPVIKFDASAKATKSRSYKYATLGAILAAVKPILAKYGFSIIQSVVSDDAGVAIGVRTTLLHESGQYMSWKNLIRLDFEAYNTGQEAGKLITYLRRYSLAAALNIYADEDVDNGDVSPDLNNDDENDQPVTQNKSAGRAALTPAKIKTKLKVTAKQSMDGDQATMQKVAMNLSEICGNDDEVRHKVQEYLFGNASLTKVSPKMWTAALVWLSPFQNEDGNYDVSDTVKTEVKQVIEKVMA